jgi:hypothetical protein
MNFIIKGLNFQAFIRFLRRKDIALAICNLISFSYFDSCFSSVQAYFGISSYDANWKEKSTAEAVQ